ncbi:MAG: hypothetical protein ACOYEV_06785 [Candidatus Nanopelagicales bacterium]
MTRPTKSLVAALPLAALAATAVLALAPTAQADLLAGGYNVSNCTITWQPGSAIAGAVSSENCIKGFLSAAHQVNVYSHPYDGRSSDSQLLSDGLVACYYYHEMGYSMDAAIAQVDRIDSSLTGGLQGRPAANVALLAFTSLCAGEGLHR